MSIKINYRDLLKNQPQREELYKFLLLLGILTIYFGYLSWQYGLATGGLVSALTWSFFVLCTPVADAGFLLDFPVRLVTGLRMFYCEMMVWVIAITLNLTTITLSPQSYEKTFLTSLLHKILTNPWPYWSIPVLCAIGTFLSVRFGDEMLDVIAHKDRKFHHKHGFKFQLISMAAFFLLVVWAYYHLIESLGIKIPTP